MHLDWSRVVRTFRNSDESASTIRQRRQVTPVLTIAVCSEDLVSSCSADLAVEVPAGLEDSASSSNAVLASYHPESLSA